jgi:[ribosomal protein S18]-alanine N-acetyltransferase
MTLEPARPEDAEAMAKVHALSFETGWTAVDIAALLAAPGGFGFLVRDDDGVQAFILVRAIVGEAEILTLATDPAARRRGFARVLIEAASAAATA